MVVLTLSCLFGYPELYGTLKASRSDTGRRRRELAQTALHDAGLDFTVNCRIKFRTKPRMLFMVKRWQKAQVLSEGHMDGSCGSAANIQGRM